MDRLGLYEELKKTTKELSLELDKQKEIQKRLEQRLDELDHLNINNAVRYAMDIRQSNEEAQSAKIDTTLAKTEGSTQSINKNEAHEFARKSTIIHIKSGSVITWIPKNASSNIRYSVAHDNGVISGIHDISWIHKNNHTFNASNKELLQAKNSFVILRNPFKRLLSFYLDKVCHTDESGNDTSYDDAKRLFNTNESTTFEEFVEIIYQKPMLISKDIHTRQQCDFMIYKKYCDYYSVERLGDAIDSIYKKTGLKLEDIRARNSIFTTKGKEKVDSIRHNTTAAEINNCMNMNKSPISESMFTEDMIGKVASLYLPDVILYHNMAPNAQKELQSWMHTLSSLSTYN